jgi:hypothetical protein
LVDVHQKKDETRVCLNVTRFRVSLCSLGNPNTTRESKKSISESKYLAASVKRKHKPETAFSTISLFTPNFSKQSTNPSIQTDDN